tara:strand:+ start:477 stop:809 length:333 start_codon:yes stop_codon:yes gene_type:complete
MAGDVPWVDPDPLAIEAVPDLLERLLAVNRALAAADRITDELLRVRYETVQAIYADPNLTVQDAAHHLDMDERRIRQYRTPPSNTRGMARKDPGPLTETRLDTEPPTWAE